MKKIDPISHVKYIEFLQKRLASKHFLENESVEEIQKTKNKLAKARLILKLIQK